MQSMCALDAQDAYNGDALSGEITWRANMQNEEEEEEEEVATSNEQTNTTTK